MQMHDVSAIYGRISNLKKYKLKMSYWKILSLNSPLVFKSTDFYTHSYYPRECLKNM